MRDNGVHGGGLYHTPGEQEHLGEEQRHGDWGDTELCVSSGRAEHQPDPHFKLSVRFFFLILGLQTSEAQVLGSAPGFAADPLARMVSYGGRSPSARRW